jgi:hypothetical protein
MRKPICLVVCWILAICSAYVLAQTSTGFSPAEQYRAIKTTVQQFYDRGLVPSNIRKPEPVITRYNRPGEYDLFYCGEAVEYLGWFEDHPSSDQELLALTDLALRMVVWESDVRKLGVPDEVWRPVLEKYESAALRHRGTNSEEERINTIGQLAAELNAQNARAGRSRPKFVTEGGCGAGEIEVHFALKPPNGQLFLIPVFLYKLCQAQKLSPTDPKRCDRWKEVFNGSVSYASGDYVYLARWADGVVRCGSLGINNFVRKRDSTIEITKLRSPECSPGW